MTLLEAGFNVNHQKALLRTLRNKGALAACPMHRKIELARFFTGPQLRASCASWALLCCTAGNASGAARARCCAALARRCSMMLPAPVGVSSLALCVPALCRATASPTC